MGDLRHADDTMAAAAADEEACLNLCWVQHRPEVAVVVAVNFIAGFYKAGSEGAKCHCRGLPSTLCARGAGP